jgi:hypothetical protein
MIIFAGEEKQHVDLEHAANGVSSFGTNASESATSREFSDEMRVYQ